jgi:hypothetical protein
LPFPPVDFPVCCASHPKPMHAQPASNSAHQFASLNSVSRPSTLQLFSLPTLPVPPSHRSTSRRRKRPSCLRCVGLTPSGWWTQARGAFLRTITDRSGFSLNYTTLVYLL